MFDSIVCIANEDASEDVDEDEDDVDIDNEDTEGNPKKAYGVSIHAMRMRRTEHSVSSDDCSSEREKGVSVCAVATRAGERMNR